MSVALREALHSQQLFFLKPHLKYVEEQDYDLIDDHNLLVFMFSEHNLVLPEMRRF